MEPLSMLAIGGGVAAVSALGQWINSDQARSASKQQLDQIKAMYQQMQSPNFDMRELTPQQYKLVGTYVPQVAQFVQQHAPQLLTGTTGNAVEGRQAQLSALRQLQNASRGQDPEMQAKIHDANMQAAEAAHTQQQNVLQDANRRGIMDSGLSLQAQLMAGANQQNQAAQSGQDAAVASYKNALQAMQQAGNLGGQIRNEDTSMEQQNASYMNQFYQQDAAQKQAYGEYAAGLQNDAQRYNLGQAQQVSNQNTQQANEYAKYNQSYGNQMAQTGFQNNQNIAAGRAGVAQQGIQQTMGQAQDTNAAIQGGANAALGGLQYYQGAQQNQDTAKYRDSQLALQRQGLSIMQQKYAPAGSGYNGSGYANPGSTQVAPDGSEDNYLLNPNKYNGGTV